MNRLLWEMTNFAGSRNCKFIGNFRIHLLGEILPIELDSASEWILSGLQAYGNFPTGAFSIGMSTWSLDEGILLHCFYYSGFSELCTENFSGPSGPARLRNGCSVSTLSLSSVLPP